MTKRVCDVCVESRQCRGKCKRYLPSDRFSKLEWERAGKPSSCRGKCLSCMSRGFDVRWCSKCKEHLRRNRFATGRMWAESDDSVRKCDKCQGKQRGMWFCKSCQKRKATEEFRMWKKAKGQKKNDGTARCDHCWQKERDAESKIGKQNARLVVKRMR